MQDLYGACRASYSVIGMWYVRKKLTAIRLKLEQVEKLEKISVREDMHVSWLIRKAIDEFLKRQR
jgi:Ribbon-helix-helix domain